MIDLSCYFSPAFGEFNELDVMFEAGGGVIKLIGLSLSGFMFFGYRFNQIV